MAQSPPEAPGPSEEFWLFGYGSLIWKPPPNFDLRVPGHIKGYVRRFWQASEDHRGTPESPGRVVTLIEQSYYEKLVRQRNLPSLHVYGAAYRIPPQHVAEVSAYLEIREINGYSIQYTDFYPAVASPGSSSPIRNCLVYIGLPTNPQFLGVQDPRDIAEVIASNRGPSGENAEYLFMLEEALDSLGEESRDEHVKDLADRVRSLQTTVWRERDGATITDEAINNEVENVISRSQGSHGPRDVTEE